MRKDGLADDDARHRVGHEPAGAIAGRDRDLALIGRHEQDDTVVLPLLAQSPGAAEAIAVILDRIALEALDGRHRERAMRLRVERVRLDLRSSSCAGRQDVGLIDDGRSIVGGKGLCRRRRRDEQDTLQATPSSFPRRRESRFSHRDGSGTPASAGATKNVVTSASTGRVEVHGRRSLRRGCRLERHLGLRSVEDLGADRGREGADQRIILTHRLVIIATRRVDAVLRTFELVLQREEIRVGLEVRIGLRRMPGAADRAAKLLGRSGTPGPSPGR